MPGEIGTVTADGLSLYATIQALNKNNFWSTGDTFEAFNAAHWANYSTLGLTELTGSNGTYVANFPTGITSADEYTVVVRQKVGSSNAVTDPVVAIGTVTWSGSAAETLNSVAPMDPWAAELPGSYGTGTAGAILGALTGFAATIWGYATRVLTAFSFTPTVAGITGTTLPAAVPSLAQMQAGLPSDSSIASDVQAGLTAQGYTPARAGYLDTLNGIVAAMWAAATRTLTAVGNSAGVTTLLSYFSGAVAPQSGDAYARLGSPAGASVSADIAAVASNILRLLGLTGHNCVIDGTSYSGSVMTAASIWIYDTKAHALTNDHSTGLLFSYTIAGTAVGGNAATQSSLMDS